MQVLILPTPVPPFSGPTKVEVRIDAIVDLSKEEEIANVYQAMTASSGLILPRTGLYHGAHG